MSDVIPDGRKLSHHPLVRQDIAQIVASPLPWSELDGKTVLVAGANGFLPAAMIDVMLELSSRSSGPRVRVIALARSRANALRRFAAHLDNPALTLHIADAAESIDVSGPIDMIVHAASQASPRFYGSDPVGTALPNILGTTHLLELARRKKSKRFLFFSSSEVYGIQSGGHLIAETAFGPLDPATPRACYAESKRMGETLCVAYGAQFGVPAVIVRPFHTYGPGMRLDDGRVFADFVRDIVSGHDIKLNSDGSAERAFCYLADATEAFFTALLKGEAGLAYNVGNANAIMAIRDLATTLTDLYPERRLHTYFKPPVPGYLASAVQRSAPDTTRLEKLGWRPRTPVAEGFRRTIDIYTDVFGVREVAA
jgi:UDP-glucuronate decarboxylase